MGDGRSKILLVEDNRLEAQVTKKFLEDRGYEVIWVEQGAAALKEAKNGGVDVVLLDLMLPDINGTEVCRWLRIDSDTRTIPIIMLTVKSSIEDKVSGLHAGADDYLPKPYNEVELVARIYACLRNKSLQDELSRRNRELTQMVERVELMAITDSLTELYNRRYFENLLEREFNRSQRYGSALACMMIDIDFFKKVNDDFGHRVGDRVLREVAHLIKRSIREVDTAARWGGEEFLVLLPETDLTSALTPSRRMQENMAASQIPGIPRQVTVSIGVSAIPHPQIDSSDKLIHAADLAMYEAKKNGRNRVELSP